MVSTKKKRHDEKLGQLLATSICGNDILSSVLYVSGIAILFAGVYAPLVLLFVVFVLFFYKSVYTEVIGALPINGGAYNCLLNGTSKTFAAIAGVMTILSYIATAVISAKVGVEYLSTLFKIPILPMTIVLLFTFTLLVISGIRDSAKVALIIFITHLTTLVLICIIGIIYLLSHDLRLNFNLIQTQNIVLEKGGIFPVLFFAFSASLLGISGFESSANFVEEQKKGVFPKTLRNMLLGVLIFNPLIAFILINVLPYEVIVSSKDFLLSNLALTLGGKILQGIVVLDAFLVLSGAVLTAFVGVSGLIYRMASDSCLPDFLTKKNSKGSYYKIIFGFFLLCSSILLLTKGDLLSLAGVYTISFLGVMSFFAFGNLILRQTRTTLKREYIAPIIFVIFAFSSTALGMLGNILIDSKNLFYFSIYFAPTILLVFGVIYQDYLLNMLLAISKPIPFLHHHIYKRFSDMIDGKFIVFVKNSMQLHSLLTYINHNETGRYIYIVTCFETEDKKSLKRLRDIQNAIPYLKKAGVYPHLTLEFVPVEGKFGPSIVSFVSKKLKVRKNRIMIGSIHTHHGFDYDDLGGVRIIFS